MNTNTLPLYHRLTKPSRDWCHVCTDWAWECPECGAACCPTCQDECTMCETPMW